MNVFRDNESRNSKRFFNEPKKLLKFLEFSKTLDSHVFLKKKIK